MRQSDAELDARWMGSLETIFMRACRAVKLCTHALWYRSSGVPCMRAERSRLRAGVRERACARVRVVCAHGEGEDARKESACRSSCARGRRMMPPPPHSSHWNRSGKNGGGPSARNAALGRGTCANAAGNTPKHVRALTYAFRRARRRPPCPTPRRFRTARFLIRIHVAGPEPLSGWVGCNFLRTGQFRKKTGCFRFVTLNFHLYR